MAEISQIVFFDGVCNFCNKTVDFLIRKKKSNEQLYFSSLQSEFAAKFMADVGIDIEDLNTIYFYNDGKITDRSSAILDLCQKLQGMYPVLGILKIVPRFIRDFFYRLFSRYRHRLFGTRESCRIPSDEEKSFFLESVEDYLRHEFIIRPNIQKESQGRHPSIYFTFVFVLFLVSPYVLYIRYGTEMEPYPAVILPSGAGFCYKDSNNIQFGYKCLYGMNKDQEWVYLNPENFLSPMPSYYIGHILNRVSWMSIPPEEKEITGDLFNWFKAKNVIRSEFRVSEKEEYCLWLSSKLRACNLYDDKLLIETHAVKQYLTGNRTREDVVTGKEIVYLK